MKLKIKIKTLIMLIILTLFLVFIIAPVANLSIATYLNQKGSDKAEAFYNNYMASPIRLNEKQGLYGYGESLIKGFGKYKIHLTGRGGGELTTPEDMEKSMESFEKLLLKCEKKHYKDGYQDKYFTNSYSKLLDISIATLDIDKLLYWIDWGRDKENQEIRYMSKLYEAYYHYVQKDYNKARGILEDFDEELDTKYYELMGDVNLRLGNLEKAKEYYERPGKNDFVPRSSYFSGYFGGSDSFLAPFEVDEYMNKWQGDYIVRGKVSQDGKGLPFVEVYLNQDLGYFSTGGVKPDAITDGNGEFETLGLKQGVYDIGIGIHSSQVYNRVFLRKDISSIEINSNMEFDFDFVTPMVINNPEEKIIIKKGESLNITWDEIKEADYYKVQYLVFGNPMERQGGLYTIPLKDKNGDEELKSNSMVFNIENLENRISAISFSGEDEIIDPMGIFGLLIPNVEYPIIVNAYDKEDNQIASSLTLINDYEDIISIEIEGNLTKGEKLILEKKYEEAISHYEEKIMDEPKDKEALFYLVRFYSIGWEKGKKDISKAFKYAEEYDKEYNDYNLSLEIVDSLYNKDFKENKDKIIKILEETPYKDRDAKYYRNMAKYYLTIGDFIKARENLEKETDYKSIDIVYIDMYLEDYKKAISTLKGGKTRLTKMNTRVVIEGLSNIENISKEDKELFKTLLKSGLANDLNREEIQDLYKNTLNSVTSLNLRNIIREIGKEEYWDIEY